MFNLGPMELMVLAIVGLVVLGPERLPKLARDAAQMLRTLRELATGARQQLRDELGPEFADVDLRTLNPRTVVSRAVFGDEFDPSSLNPRTAARNAIFGDADLQAADPRQAFRETRDEIYGRGASDAARADQAARGATPIDQPVRFTKSEPKPVSQPVTGRAPSATRPRPRPAPRSSYDDMT